MLVAIQVENPLTRQHHMISMLLLLAICMFLQLVMLLLVVHHLLFSTFRFKHDRNSELSHNAVAEAAARARQVVPRTPYDISGYTVCSSCSFSHGSQKSKGAKEPKEASHKHFLGYFLGFLGSFVFVAFML
jgi:hypothetical protein